MQTSGTVTVNGTTYTIGNTYSFKGTVSGRASSDGTGTTAMSLDELKSSYSGYASYYPKMVLGGYNKGAAYPYALYYPSGFWGGVLHGWFKEDVFQQSSSGGSTTPTYATITSVTDTQIGSAPKVKWTAESTKVYTLTFKLGSKSVTTETIVPGVNAAYTYSGYALPLSFCSQLPSAVTGKMTVVLQTYAREGAGGKGTFYGKSSKEFTVSVPSGVVPTIDSYTVTDLTPFNSYHVQNISTAKATINATGAYGSSIVRYEMTFDSLYTNTSTNKEITALVPVSGTVTITLKAVDSRGATASKSITWTVYEYAAPKITDLSITRDGETITISAGTAVTDINETNMGVLKIIRSHPNDETEPVTVSTTTGLVGSDTTTATDTVSDVDTINYIYRAEITDTTGATEMKELRVRSGVDNRFVSLSTDEYFVSVDDEGNKVKNAALDLTIKKLEDGSISYIRNDLGTVFTGIAGLGIPVPVEEGAVYDLTYSANVTKGTVLSCIGWFSYNATTDKYTYLDTTDVEGDTKITAPTDADWGLIVFYSKEKADFVLSDIVFRQLKANEEKDIAWMIETGEVGLSTPNQKFISRIQIRARFQGTMRVLVQWDNGQWQTVYSRRSHELKSFTVPIRVKRCDHMKLRLEGEGAITLYSIGYITDEGSEICLI